MKQLSPHLLQEFLKDIGTIKAILKKYEDLFSPETEKEPIVTLRDIMTEQEKRELDELKMDLLEAMSSRERAELMSDIDRLFDQAKSRYYNNLRNENNV